METPAPNQQLIKKAATVLVPKIKGYKFQNVQNILQSDFPTDTGITDTKMAALSVACSLPEKTEQDKQNNRTLLVTILQQNPNINHKDSLNRTPLHHACNIGNETAVELLIEYGFKNPHEALNG